MELKKAYDYLWEKVQKLFPSMSAAGEMRLGFFFDELHWVLFEREPALGPRKRSRGKTRVGYGISESGGNIVSIIVYRDGEGNLSKEFIQELERDAEDINVRLKKERYT